MCPLCEENLEILRDCSCDLASSFLENMRKTTRNGIPLEEVMNPKGKYFDLASEISKLQQNE